MQDVTSMLNGFTSQPSHSFWQDGPIETGSDLWSTVTNPKQVTDLNLVLIARRNGGRLVTFDGAIRNRLPEEQRQWIEVIEG
jgi:hypothetical protein